MFYKPQISQHVTDWEEAKVRPLYEMVMKSVREYFEGTRRYDTNFKAFDWKALRQKIDAEEPHYQRCGEFGENREETPSRVLYFGDNVHDIVKADYMYEMAKAWENDEDPVLSRAWDWISDGLHDFFYSGGYNDEYGVVFEDIVSKRLGGEYSFSTYEEFMGFSKAVSHEEHQAFWDNYERPLVHEAKALEARRISKQVRLAMQAF